MMWLLVIVYSAFDSEFSPLLTGLSQRNYFIIWFCFPPVSKIQIVPFNSPANRLTVSYKVCSILKEKCICWKNEQCAVTRGPAGHKAVKHNTLACQSGWGNLFSFITELKAVLISCTGPVALHLHWGCVYVVRCGFSCVFSLWWTFSCLYMIDSILTICKERKGERKLCFD